MSRDEQSGIIRADEAYSKQALLRVLPGSQKVWDKLIDEGLPFTEIGKCRYVTGRAVIEHFTRRARTKRETT